MRIVVAGASGVVGRTLLPQLRIGGRTVIALSRNRDRAAQMRQAGFETIVADALDGEALRDVVIGAKPEIIINQLTNLPRSLLNPRTASKAAARTNELRSVGGKALAEAASTTGAHLISQSIAFAQRPGEGVRVEDDPLYTDGPRAHAAVVAAVQTLEQATIEAGGTVLRYGAFYGPGTYFAPGEAYPNMLHRRLLPVIGQGRGVWGLLHLEDAADATIKAMVAPPGVYNVVDDDPVTTAELLPWMAEVLGTKAPRRLPRAFFALGPPTILRYLFDEQPSVSSERARNILGWAPAHPSWRGPLAELLAATADG